MDWLSASISGHATWSSVTEEVEADVLVFVSSGNEDESVFTSVDDSDSVGIVEDDDIDVALFTAYQS